MNIHTSTPSTACIFTHKHTRERYTLTLAIAQATRQRDRQRNASLHETSKERDGRVYGALGVRHCSTLPDTRNTYTPPSPITPPDSIMNTIIVYDETGAYAANAKIPIKRTDVPFETRVTVFTTPTSTVRLPVTLVYDTDAPDDVLLAALETGVEVYRVLNVS